MNELSIGKQRRLQQCATREGHFVILAVDHRDNLREYLAKAWGTAVSDAEMTAFKLDVTAALNEVFSAVLLDPIFSLKQAIRQQVVPGSAGLLSCIEKSGYGGNPAARETAVLPDWSVKEIAAVGGTGVKMLLYYHPEAANAARQEEVVRFVAEQCARHEVPFFLEPIAYSLHTAVKTLSTAEKRAIVLAAARRLTPLGVDILKAEFPVNIKDEPDEAAWLEACAELTETSRTPWVLLSAGVGFEDFARQARVACQAGCSGVMVGRAVWQEAIPLQGAARRQFLQETAVPRLQQLAQICKEYGRGWFV